MFAPAGRAGNPQARRRYCARIVHATRRYRLRRRRRRRLDADERLPLAEVSAVRAVTRCQLPGATADDMPVACPIGRSKPGTHRHFRAAQHTGSRTAERQADPLRTPTCKQEVSSGQGEAAGPLVAISPGEERSIRSLLDDQFRSSGRIRAQTAQIPNLISAGSIPVTRSPHRLASPSVKDRRRRFLPNRRWRRRLRGWRRPRPQDGTPSIRAIPRFR